MSIAWLPTSARQCFVVHKMDNVLSYLSTRQQEQLKPELRALSYQKDGKRLITPGYWNIPPVLSYTAPSESFRHYCYNRILQPRGYRLLEPSPARTGYLSLWDWGWKQRSRMPHSSARSAYSHLLDHECSCLRPRHFSRGVR